MIENIDGNKVILKKVNKTKNKFPEKYNISSKVTGECLEEPNSRNLQFQYGFNAAIEAIKSATCSEDDRRDNR